MPQHEIIHQTPHEEMPAEWREFAAGMEFLRRYGTHNTANARAIGRDNLRLLHRSLLQKTDYRHKITQASKEMQGHGRPNKTSLAASHQLSAQLISLPMGSSIQLIVRASERAMFMILSGRASTAVQPASNTRSHWWPDSWPKSWPLSPANSPRSHTLKSDDILCITHGQSSPCVLSSRKKACLVLAVFISQGISQGISPGNAQKLPQHHPADFSPVLRNSL